MCGGWSRRQGRVRRPFVFFPTVYRALRRGEGRYAHHSYGASCGCHSRRPFCGVSRVALGLAAVVLGLFFRWTFHFHALFFHIVLLVYALFLFLRFPLLPFLVVLRAGLLFLF